MNDFILSKTRIETIQMEGSGEIEIIPIGGFMITDIIMSSSSFSQATLIATDGENTHIVKSLRGEESFNHSFAGGWVFWKEASLKLIKEKDGGIVDIAIGYVRATNAPSYNQWRFR